MLLGLTAGFLILAKGPFVAVPSALCPLLSSLLPSPATDPEFTQQLPSGMSPAQQTGPLGLRTLGQEEGVCVAVGSVALRRRKEPKVCPPASPKSRAAEWQHLCPGVGPWTCSLPRRRVNTSMLGCPLCTRIYDDLIRPSQHVFIHVRAGEGRGPSQALTPGCGDCGVECPLPAPSPVHEEGSCHRDPALDSERSGRQGDTAGLAPFPSCPSPILGPRRLVRVSAPQLPWLPRPVRSIHGTR